MQLNTVSGFVSIFGQPKTSLILLLFCESTETSEQLLPDTVLQCIICHQMCISAACQICYLLLQFEPAGTNLSLLEVQNGQVCWRISWNHLLVLKWFCVNCPSTSLKSSFQRKRISNPDFEMVWSPQKGSSTFLLPLSILIKIFTCPKSSVHSL